MANETITESDIWADIDAVFALPLREEGDIDVMQIMARYDMPENSARNRMRQLVRTGKWEFVTVGDFNSGTGSRKIIRRVRKNG